MNKKLSLVLLFVCVALFAVGLVQLFKLRFEAGDVYPAYSSLRTDPLGTRALYESLERMPGLSVRRDYSRANRLPEGKATSYLHLGAHEAEWRTVPEEIFKEVEAFAIRGGRLLITLFPETRKPLKSRLSEKARANQSPKKKAAREKPQKGPTEDQPGASRSITLRERWGIEFAFLNLDRNPDGTYQSVAATNQTADALAASLSWHSGVVFTNLAPTWRVIYARDSHPVVIERKFGAGTIVFATDSFFLSNQAMREERHADLLAWLVDPSKQVVFDEAHLGVLEDPGVATLIRRYRLHSVVASLVLLAGLFLWKNSLSLVPADPDEVREADVLGKDSAAGFVNLLRRNIPARDMLGVCFAEWKKSFGHGTKASPAKQARIQDVIDAENALSPRERNPLRAYQAISAILSERTWKISGKTSDASREG